MVWAIGIFFAVMLGLYIWSHVTAGHAIGKKVQPFIDDLFGVSPKPDKTPRIRTTSRQGKKVNESNR